MEKIAYQTLASSPCLINFRLLCTSPIPYRPYRNIKEAETGFIIAFMALCSVKSMITANVLVEVKAECLYTMRPRPEIQKCLQ
jgi:hypothetical protein